MTSPLRGPKSTEGGGFAAAHFRARRVCYGAAPPASTVLRIPLRGTRLRRAVDPGDRCGPWARKSGQAQACPRAARGTRNPAVAGHKSQPNVRTQVNWRSIVAKRRKITNLGWCQGSSEADPSRIK
jgi:hypothetical protein